MRRQSNAIPKPGAILLLTALLAASLGLVACQARRVPAVGTDVGAGDRLHGRLVQGRKSQAFTFEGVESSLLSFTLKADEANQASPDVTLLDPEGKRILLSSHVQTAKGAATMVVEDLILLRTGTYQVTVTPPNPCQPVYWRFNHCLTFPQMEDFHVTLTACGEHPIYLSAPRGGWVVVQVKPERGSALVPVFKAVKDPWGGRALDPERRPSWAPKPVVSRAVDGTLFLNFVAPIPGRYTIVASARPGKEGPAIVSTQVRPAPGPAREVAHPNRRPQDYGLPAAGSASDAGR